MSKASSGDNSSLELLLDTMCNTFGAVMFIAISLLVITAMLGKVNSASEPPADPETWRTMRSELESLEREYARSRDMLEIMKPFAEHLQQDQTGELDCENLYFHYARNAPDAAADDLVLCSVLFVGNANRRL